MPMIPGKDADDSQWLSVPVCSMLPQATAGVCRHVLQTIRTNFKTYIIMNTAPTTSTSARGMPTWVIWPGAMAVAWTWCTTATNIARLFCLLTMAYGEATMWMPFSSGPLRRWRPVQARVLVRWLLIVRLSGYIVSFLDKRLSVLPCCPLIHFILKGVGGQLFFNPMHLCCRKLLKFANLLTNN